MTTAPLPFTLTSTLVILAPCPDSLLVMRNTVRNTVRNGRRAGWVTAGGTLSGLLVWVVGRGAGWLRRPGVQRWPERVTGIALIGLGLRPTTETR